MRALTVLLGMLMFLLATGCSSSGKADSTAQDDSPAGQDKECEGYLKEPLACEAKEWLAKPNTTLWKGDRKRIAKLIDEFYAAGAAKVHASPDKLESTQVCALFIITLPTEADARKKVFGVEAAFYKEVGDPSEATKDEGQKFLKFPLD